MIYINGNVKEKLDKFRPENMHIICDFDATLTRKDCPSSFGLIENILPKKASREINWLYNTYHPLEVNENITFAYKYKLMRDWWSKEFELYKKYNLTEIQLEKAVQNINTYFMRDGVVEFFLTAKKKNIPIIILSSGVGNVIQRVLEINNCNHENVFLLANFIKFENGVADGLVDHLIHGLNKNEKSLPNKVYECIQKRPKVLLFGDTVGDACMSNAKKEDCVKFGFLEEKEERMPTYKDVFDVVCTNNTSFQQLDEIFNFFPSYSNTNEKIK